MHYFLYLILLIFLQHARTSIASYLLVNTIHVQVVGDAWMLLVQMLVLQYAKFPYKFIKGSKNFNCFKR